MNNETSYGYYSNGELYYLTDGNYKTTTYGYDSLDQIQTESQHNGSDGGTNTTTYTYDHDGDLTGVIDGNGDTTTYTYDPADRLVAVTDGNDHTTTYTYDGDGNETTVTDPLGHITTYVYDADDRQVSETDPSGGGTTTTTYDPAGNVLTVTDPDSNTTTYTYDADNREATETSPTGGVTTYTYDLVGNLVETVDPDGHTITYSYDADNRETGETWVNPEGGTPLDVFTTTYDADGNVTSIGDDNSSYAYTYDTDNRLASDTADYTVASDVPEVTLTYAYDGVGNTTSLSDSLGGVISYYYNDQNQVTRVSQSGSGEDPESIDFTYDHAGNMTGQTDNSDPYGEDEVLSTSYTYDNANNLTGISDQLPDSTVVASYSYTLDAADRLTQETRTWADGSSSDTTDYTYTANNQLTGVTHSNSSFANESFSYDANGNRTMTGDSTGTGNELTSDGTYDYTYDNDGNLITQTDIATGDETIYSYDFRNRLVEVQQVVGGVESVLAQYTYDALNRRIGVSEGGSTTWTVYDGKTTNPLIDFDNSGDVTARYLNGPSPAGVDAVLARDTPSGGVAWYLADRLGSVGDIVDNSGTVIDHIDYSAFGEVLDESDPAEGDRFKFAGMQYDSVIGQYYDQARWYDPESGRFDSSDPAGLAAGDDNTYRYTANGPTNFTDPTGDETAQQKKEREVRQWRNQHWFNPPDPNTQQDPAIPKWHHPGAPTPDQLCQMIMNNQAVINAMNAAWQDMIDHPGTGERGGWILWNPATNQITVSTAGAKPYKGRNGQNFINLRNPSPVNGFPIVVATFHAHPGVDQFCLKNPSTDDRNATTGFGVPGIIVGGPDPAFYWMYNGPKNFPSAR